MSKQLEQKRAPARALALVDAAAEREVTLRIMGGIAVSLLCRSSREGVHKDIDLVGLSKQRRDVERVLIEAGLEPDERFNALRGRRRLLFDDPELGMSVDVFFDRLEMCHDLDIRKRLQSGPTLDPTDLILTKLQIVEQTERDRQDAVELLRDVAPDGGRIASLLADDWGWWRTATESLKKARSYAIGEYGESAEVCARIDALLSEIDRAPKSRRWRARAVVGERKAWYRLPEEIVDESFE